MGSDRQDDQRAAIHGQVSGQPVKRKAGDVLEVSPAATKNDADRQAGRATPEDAHAGLRAFLCVPPELSPGRSKFRARQNPGPGPGHQAGLFPDNPPFERAGTANTNFFFFFGAREVSNNRTGDHLGNIAPIRAPNPSTVAGPSCVMPLRFGGYAPGSGSSILRPAVKPARDTGCLSGGSSNTARASYWIFRSPGPSLWLNGFGWVREWE